MDLKALARREVKMAYKLIGTLATTVTFTLVTAKKFNFGTKLVELSDDIQTVTTKGVPTDEKSGGQSVGGAIMPSTTMTKTLMFDATTVGHPDLYDSATFDGYTWRIIPPFTSDEYLTYIIFARET